MSFPFPRLALCLVPVPALLCACDGLTRAAAVPVHYVSHQLCSAAFVGGLEPDQFYRESIEPEIAPADTFIDYRVDRAKAEVTASMKGVVTSRASWLGAQGCQIQHQGVAPRVAAGGNARGPSLLPPIAGSSVVTPADPRLAAALDRAFAENRQAPYRRTKAVIVVHDGRVVAERYAPGYGIDTPQMGWSMTKSVVNALIGVLVRHGRLSITDPAPVAAWSDARDPRHGITVEQLMRMTSGLEIGDSMTATWTTAFDPSAQMVYDMPDMAAFAERARLGAAPGSRFAYANGNTLLLSRIIRDKVGGDAGSVLRFAHRELFDKLGMTGVTLELDAAGTPIGSSHMWATARDWARFGLLYLNDGVVGGQRILPEGWVDYSARMTAGSEIYGYGAGFWTNRGSGSGAAYHIKAGLPADAFMARGIHGQYVIVVPSAKLVVVRMGPAYTPRDDMEVVARLVGDAIAALQAPE